MQPQVLCQEGQKVTKNDRLSLDPMDQRNNARLALRLVSAVRSDLLASRHGHCAVLTRDLVIQRVCESATNTRVSCLSPESRCIAVATYARNEIHPLVSNVHFVGFR